MVKKYSVLIGMLVSLVFFSIAIAIYPGGTYQDRNSVGFDWTKNYFSNLFEQRALNGIYNRSMIWAYIGMFVYAISCTLFFINMSKKIPDNKAAIILKYTGILTMPFTFLIITPLHDLMLTISSVLFWTCMVLITVFVMKTRLHFFKCYCLLCLLIFYYALYIHLSSNWDVLPIVQKVNTITTIALILGLEYFTKREDFDAIKREQEQQ